MDSEEYLLKNKITSSWHDLTVSQLTKILGDIEKYNRKYLETLPMIAKYTEGKIEILEYSHLKRMNTLPLK